MKNQLTNPQIDELIERAVNTAYPGKLPYRPTPADYQIVKETLKMVIAWGVEPCPHWYMHPEVGVIKRDCSQCWQALTKLAGEK